MAEHDPTIFSSFLLSPTSLTEAYTSEMDKNNEFLFENSKIFSDILAWTDNDDASSTSSMDSKDSEMGILNDNEMLEKDEIIDRLEQAKFTSCVIIDFIDGKIQRCGESGKLRQLRNLFGTWQVDRDAVKEVDGILSKLGVCNSHFQFDNKYL